MVSIFLRRQREPIIESKYGETNNIVKARNREKADMMQKELEPCLESHTCA
jgi:hypothetical protein